MACRGSSPSSPRRAPREPPRLALSSATLFPGSSPRSSRREGARSFPTSSLRTGLEQAPGSPGAMATSGWLPPSCWQPAAPASPLGRRRPWRSRGRWRGGRSRPRAWSMPASATARRATPTSSIGSSRRPAIPCSRWRRGSGWSILSPCAGPERGSRATRPGRLAMEETGSGKTIPAFSAALRASGSPCSRPSRRSSPPGTGCSWSRSRPARGAGARLPAPLRRPAMDWNAPYIISGSLRLEISPAGKLVLSGSPSRKPQEAQLDSIPVLLGFAAGATPRDVFDRLKKDWEIEEAGFAEVVESMEAQELLTPAGEGENGPRLSERGFGSVLAHFVMLKDPVRVLSYKSAIERHARGKNVVEIGCGTGVLSLFAARAGASRVTAIEETRIAKVAARMFAANGCSGLVDLRVANSRDVELDEPADLIIHELLGVDPFEENLLPYLDDARRRLLRPGGRFLPYRLEVCCIGIEMEEPPTPAREDRTLEEARELSGLYGLDFGPFLEALADSRPRPATSRTWIEGKSGFDPRILSEEQ